MCKQIALLASSAFLVAGCSLLAPTKAGLIENLDFWLEAPEEANPDNNHVVLDYVIENRGELPVELAFAPGAGNVGFDLVVMNSTGSVVWRAADEIIMFGEGDASRPATIRLEPGEVHRTTTVWGTFELVTVDGEPLPGGTYQLQGYLFDMEDPRYLMGIPRPNYEEAEQLLETEPVTVKFHTDTPGRHQPSLR